MDNDATRYYISFCERYDVPFEIYEKMYDILHDIKFPYGINYQDGRDFYSITEKTMVEIWNEYRQDAEDNNPKNNYCRKNNILWQDEDAIEMTIYFDCNNFRAYARVITDNKLIILKLRHIFPLIYIWNNN